MISALTLAQAVECLNACRKHLRGDTLTIHEQMVLADECSRLGIEIGHVLEDVRAEVAA